MAMTWQDVAAATNRLPVGELLRAMETAPAMPRPDRPVQRVTDRPEFGAFYVHLADHIPVPRGVL